MSSARAWPHGEPSGRPGLWSWRGTWRPCGPSSGSSAPSSRTADASGHGPSVSSASRTSGSASSWPRWDSPDPRSLGKVGADAWVLVGGGYTAHEAEAWASRGFHCPPPTHPQASQTEQELQKELDGLRGQCQAQALAGAELRTQLESLQGEVSAGWGWGLSTQESGAGGSSRLAQHIPSSSEAFPQNQMLQSRRQDLEAQIRGLREEMEQGQGRLQATHEELLLLRRERREHSLEVTHGVGVGASIQLGPWLPPQDLLGDEAREGSLGAPAAGPQEHRH